MRLWRLAPVRRARANYHRLRQQQEVRLTTIQIAGVAVDTEAPDGLTLEQMATVYNEISGAAPVGRFRDRATGLAALKDALSRYAPANPPAQVEPRPDATAAVPGAAPSPSPAYNPPYQDSDVITLMVTENPKRPGSSSAKRFTQYQDGMTVGQAIAAGLRRDLMWDWEHKFISIGKAIAG